MTINKDNQSEASDLRRNAEKLVNKNGSGRKSQVSEIDTLKLIHELEVHQIELEMQMDEVRRSRAELEQSQLRYSELYDYAPIGYFTLNEKGKILEVNLTAANMLGRNRADLIGMDITHFIFPDDLEIYFSHNKNLFESRKQQVCEMRMKSSGGSLFWAKLEAVVAQDTGSQAACFLVMSNITTQKESEDKYRLLVENSGLGVGLYDLNGKILYFNQRTIQNLGGKCEDYIGKTMEDVFGKETAEVYTKRILKVAESDQTLDFEDYLELPSGNFWFLSTQTRIKNPDGTIFGVQVLVLDITEQKEAEIALKESEDKYKKLVELSPDAIVVHSEGVITYVNTAAVESIGAVTAKDLIGRNALDFVHPDYRSIAIERISNLMVNKTKAGLTHEKFIRLDGKVIDVETTAIPFVYGGKPSIQLIVRDISDRLRMEEALRKSETQYRLLAENMSDMVWMMDLELNTIYASPSVEKKGGYTYEELQQIPVEKKLTPSSFKYLTERFARELPDIISNPKNYTPTPIDLEVIHKDGTIYWLEIIYNIIRDEKGNPASILCVGRDITSHKLLSEKLSDSEEKLNLFFSQSLDGFFFMMIDEPVAWDDSTDKEKALDYIFSHTRITKVNKAMLDQYGATEEQFLGYTPADFFALDNQHGRSVLKDLFNNGHLHADTKELKFDGTEMIIEGDYICLYDSEKRITGHFGIQREVTVGRVTEAKIKQQLDELQRWQVVTLGREDRNMELKREVNQLLARLGDPIRYPSQDNKQG